MDRLYGRGDAFGASIVYISGGRPDGIIKVVEGSVSWIWMVNLTTGINQPETGSGRGGAIENEGTLTLENVRISNSSAHQGGAIFSNKNLTLTACVIDNNHTFAWAGLGDGWGGGLSLAGSGVTTITGSQIAGNTAVNRGGGIAIRFTHQVTLTDTDVIGNGTSEWGGGVYNSGGTFSMTRGNLSFNGASVSGGGLAHPGGNSTLMNVLVQGNNADRGGGVFVGGPGFFMTGGWIDDNRSRKGGGIYQAGGASTVRNVTVSNNTAFQWGGGAYSEGGTLTFDAATFAANQATGGGAKLAKWQGNPLAVIDVMANCVGVVQTDVDIDPDFQP